MTDDGLVTIGDLLNAMALGFVVRPRTTRPTPDPDEMRARLVAFNLRALADEQRRLEDLRTIGLDTPDDERAVAYRAAVVRLLKHRQEHEDEREQQHEADADDDLR